MPMYKFIVYSDNYLKICRSFWQYYRDEPHETLKDSESFKSKVKITGKTPDDGKIMGVEIAVPLTYLINFGRTLERLLINCEINLILT